MDKHIHNNIEYSHSILYFILKQPQEAKEESRLSPDRVTEW